MPDKAGQDRGTDAGGHGLVPKTRFPPTPVPTSPNGHQCPGPGTAPALLCHLTACRTAEESASQHQAVT